MRKWFNKNKRLIFSNMVPSIILGQNPVPQKGNVGRSLPPVPMNMHLNQPLHGRSKWRNGVVNGAPIAFLCLHNQWMTLVLFLEWHAGVQSPSYDCFASFFLGVCWGPYTVDMNMLHFFVQQPPTVSSNGRMHHICGATSIHIWYIRSNNGLVNLREGCHPTWHCSLDICLEVPRLVQLKVVVLLRKLMGWVMMGWALGMWWHLLISRASLVWIQLLLLPLPASGVKFSWPLAYSSEFQIPWGTLWHICIKLVALLSVSNGMEWIPHWRETVWWLKSKKYAWKSHVYFHECSTLWGACLQ